MQNSDDSEYKRILEELELDPVKFIRLYITPESVEAMLHRESMLARLHGAMGVPHKIIFPEHVEFREEYDKVGLPPKSDIRTIVIGDWEPVRQDKYLTIFDEVDSEGDMLTKDTDFRISWKERVRNFWHSFRIWLYSLTCDHDKLFQEGWEGQPDYHHCPKCGKTWEVE